MYMHCFNTTCLPGHHQNYLMAECALLQEGERTSTRSSSFETNVLCSS